MPDHPTIARADIIIIGAGIMGAMSGRTFGQIRQHYSNELMVELSIRGFDTLNN